VLASIARIREGLGERVRDPQAGVENRIVML
jgi:hypothetical protein